MNGKRGRAPRAKQCPTCNGTGTKPGTLDTDCGTCSGTGEVDD